VVSADSQSSHSKETRRQRRKRRGPISQTYWAREQVLDNVDASDVAAPVRNQLLHQYGHFSLAYSAAVQPLLNHFGDADGCIAYRQRYGITLALGDALVDDASRDELLLGFVKHFRNTVFCQISRSTAEVLSANGFYVNEMGVDTSLDLADYSLAGKQKEWLRYAYNWITRRDYQIIESDFDQVDVNRVEAISEAWRKTRTVKQKEVRFLNRPIVLEQEPGVRRFFLVDADQNLQAYVFLDPLYQDGKIVGYVTSFKRRHPDAPQYAEHAIMKYAIEKLKAEGVGRLNLGLSPCAWIDEGNVKDGDVESSEINHPQFEKSWFTQFMFSKTYNSKILNRRVYNLVGHANYKRRFRGREEKVYFASRSKFGFRQFASLISLCGIA
jgi:phosphatidylglycerol lysyltransferase